MLVSKTLAAVKKKKERKDVLPCRTVFVDQVPKVMQQEIPSL